MKKLLFIIVTAVFLSSCSSELESNFINQISYLKDANYTFQEIKKEDFKILKSPKISYKNGFYWFKIVLNETNKANKKLFFMVDEPSINELAVYDNDGIIGTEKSKIGNPVIILEIKNRNKPFYYVKANFKRQVHFPLHIYNTSQFYKVQEKKNLVFGFYYGIALMVFILNLIFYISLKDNTFIYYCFFMSCINLSFMAFDGVAYFFFDQITFDDFVIIFHYLIQVFGALFASNFLNLKTFYPKLNKIGFILIAINALFYLGFYITNNFLYFAIADLIGILILAYYWFCGILMIKKEEFAIFFVLGYCMALFAAIFFLTPLNFGISSIKVSFNQLKLGNIIEMLILTYAITYRVKKLQKENFEYKNELKIYFNEIFGLKEQLKLQEINDENNYNKKLLQLKENFELTDREMGILIKITEGFTNSQIAEQLFISINTVKYHTKNIYIKLDIKKRSQVSSKILLR